MRSVIVAVTGLLLCMARVAFGFDVLVEVNADLASFALDRGSGSFYVFTAAYDQEPIPSSGLITEYRRDGTPIAAYGVPESVVAQGSRNLGYDPFRQVFILGGSGSESPTSDFDKGGQVRFTYGFKQVTGTTGGVSSLDIDRYGIRYYAVGSYDPYHAVAVDPTNLHDGDILASEAKVLYTMPLAFDAGGFTRDFKTGKFLLASGIRGVIRELNKRGRTISSYSLADLGFGYAFYHGSGGGYFIDDIALEPDGSLLIGAAYGIEGDIIGWRVLRFSRSEWRSLRAGK
jgi:hypothetical protein